MSHTTIRLGLGIAALGVAIAGTIVTAQPASAKQDTDCMRAGMQFLKDNGLLTTVAETGLPVATAVSVGVTAREGTDVSALPDPLPLSVILADHRAGESSLFIYPWC